MREWAIVAAFPTMAVLAAWFVVMCERAKAGYEDDTGFYPGRPAGQRPMFCGADRRDLMRHVDTYEAWRRAEGDVESTYTGWLDAPYELKLTAAATYQRALEREAEFADRYRESVLS